MHPIILEHPTHISTPSYNIERGKGYLLSIRASSPSTCNAGLGVLASSTKWLSQWGQYSSLSSNSAASLRKHFLHFLQANVYTCQFLFIYILLCRPLRRRETTGWVPSQGTWREHVVPVQSGILRSRTICGLSFLKE